MGPDPKMCEPFEFVLLQYIDSKFKVLVSQSQRVSGDAI
jgi:hypothetical protein